MIFVRIGNVLKREKKNRSTILELSIKASMNKQRRKEIEDLHDELQNLQERLETIMEEEEEYKDNPTENMLNRIEQSENAIYAMQEACECITSAINNLEEIE